MKILLWLKNKLSKENTSITEPPVFATSAREIKISFEPNRAQIEFAKSVIKQIEDPNGIIDDVREMLDNE